MRHVADIVFLRWNVMDEIVMVVGNAEMFRFVIRRAMKNACCF